MSQELQAYLGESVDKVDRFRRVGSALRVQCANLEEENMNLRTENRELSRQNVNFR